MEIIIVRHRGRVIDSLMFPHLMAEPELDTCLFKTYLGYSSPDQWLPHSTLRGCGAFAATPPGPRTCSGVTRRGVWK